MNARPDDATFHEVSAYGSAAWVAARLGRSNGWLRDHREQLTVAGFPAPDRITGYWIKADVDQWIEARRSLPGSATPPSREAKSKIIGVRNEYF